MRVLFFNNHYKAVITNPDVRFICDLDLAFEGKSFIQKIKRIFELRKQFDRFVIYVDYRLAFALALIFKICFLKKEIYLHEFYLPELNSKNSTKYLCFYLLFHLVDCTIVHSKEDVKYLSDFFRVPKENFQFIPYFYYTDIQPVPEAVSINKILIPGRHRDLQTFLNIANDLPFTTTILGGYDDKIDVSNKNVTCLWEVEKSEYDRVFDEADIICIPLFKDKYKRSLGQIAILRAYTRNKILIVSDTPCVRDYISDDVCLTFEPENSMSLKKAFDELQKMSDLQRHRMLKRANAFVAQFNREYYANRLEYIITH